MNIIETTTVNSIDKEAIEEQLYNIFIKYC